VIERVRILPGDQIPGGRSDDRFLVTNDGPHIKAERIAPAGEFPMSAVQLTFKDADGQEIGHTTILPSDRGQQHETWLELPEGLARIDVEVQ
jgi:hypothetical protein